MVDRDERRIDARELDLVAVDVRDADVAAAHRRAAHAHRAPRSPRQVDDRRIRMRLLQIDLLEREDEPLLLGDGQRLADALVVGRKAQDARDQRLVRAVAAVRLRERPVQVAEDLAGHEAEPHRTRRVRARRADHDRPDYVKYTVHMLSLSLLHADTYRNIEIQKAFKTSTASSRVLEGFSSKISGYCPLTCSGSISESGMRSGPAA